MTTYVYLRIIFFLALLGFLQNALASSSLDSKLLKAVLRNDVNSVNTLLVRGANPNAMSGIEVEDWAMCAASYLGHVQSLEALLTHGGDPNLPNKLADFRYSLPLMCAVWGERIEAVELLLENGAINQNIPCPGCSSIPPRTVFQEALYSGSLEEALAISRHTSLREDELEVLKYIVDYTRYDPKGIKFPAVLELADVLTSYGIEHDIWTPDKDARKMREKRGASQPR